MHGDTESLSPLPLPKENQKKKKQNKIKNKKPTKTSAIEHFQVVSTWIRGFVEAVAVTEPHPRLHLILSSQLF